MQKVSEWLSEIDGHSALNVAPAKVDFEQKTGEKWPAHVNGRLASDLIAEGREDYKGLQSWGGKPTDRVVSGWHLASALADQMIGFRSGKMGRGRIFWECVGALKRAGK